MVFIYSILIDYVHIDRNPSAMARKIMGMVLESWVVEIYET